MATPPNQLITNIDAMLLEAIEANSDISVIDEIIYGDNYVNINVQNLLLESPLHIATRNNNSKIVACLLLNKNTRPNLQNAYGDTALHIAIRNGYIEIAKLILNDWRSTHWLTNKNKESILHMVLSKNIPELYPLVKKQFVNNRDILGYTPFMYAILQYYQSKNNFYDYVIYNLLDCGAVVEIPDILDDIGEIWKSFIHHPNFDIESDIKLNMNLFGYSCDRGNMELLTELCNFNKVNNIENYIMIAVRKQNIDCTIKLLTLDIEYNKTPLKDLTKQLFFLNVFNEDDLNRILLILLDSNRIKISEIIKYSMVYYRQYVFKRFINKESIDTLKVNIEHILVVCCIIYPELFIYIMDHFEINNNIVDKYDNTILNLVVQQTVYSNQIIRKLIKIGYDPNKTNQSGKTPLDYAIIYRNIEMIRELLPITTLTVEDRLYMITKHSIIPSSVLFPILNINWLETIKVMKVGIYQSLLDLIDDSGGIYNKDLLGYIIGKDDGYRRYLEVLVNIKQISIDNSHNTIDIWTLETMESEDIIQYGVPINGKYKTLTIKSVIELVRQTEDYVSLGYIKDPFDRSSLHEQLSYPNGYPFFIEVLLRKLID
jgi:ankyrin repeat protein